MSYAGTGTVLSLNSSPLFQGKRNFWSKTVVEYSLNYNNVSQNSTLFIKALNAIVMYSTIAAHFYML